MNRIKFWNSSVIVGAIIGVGMSLQSNQQNVSADAYGYNYPVVTTYDNDEYTQLYDKFGEPIPSYVLPPNTDWQITDTKWISNTLYYRVSTNAWVSNFAGYSNLDVEPSGYNYNVAKIVNVKSAAIYAYLNEGFDKLNDKYVAPFTDWRVTNVKKYRSDYMLEIGDNQWIRSQDANCNFDLDYDQISFRDGYDYLVAYYLNGVRLINKLDDVQLDDDYIEEARKQANDYVEYIRNNPERVNDGGSFIQRMNGEVVGMNIAVVGKYDGFAEPAMYEAINQWYESKNGANLLQRKNMLNPYFKKFGVGVSELDENRLVVVALFVIGGQELSPEDKKAAQTYFDSYEQPNELKPSKFK